MTGFLSPFLAGSFFAAWLTALVLLHPVPAKCQAAPCATNAGGINSWWTFEGHTRDAVNTNHGIRFGNSAPVSGVVGQAMRFDRGHDYVLLPASPSLDLGAGEGFTIEFWIRVDTPESQDPIIEWNNGGRVGLRMWTSYLGGPGCVFADITTTVGWSNPMNTPAGLLGNSFHHVALTYDKTSGYAILYFDGQESFSRFFGELVPETRYDLYLGRRAGQTYYLGGALDELALYRRALSAAEILAIANAGNNGKCHTLVPPAITRQPAWVDGVIGDAVSLSVEASGFPPFAYQWFRDGVPLPAGTNAVLTLAGAQASDAGAYSVRVTNAEGTATSSNAIVSLRVVPPCVAPPANLVTWWPLEGSGDDFVGTNRIVFGGSPAFDLAAVGRGLMSGETNSFGRIAAGPSLDIGAAAAGFTIELWVKPTNASLAAPLIEWNNGQSTIGLQLWTSVATAGGGAGAVYANLVERTGAGRPLTSPPGVLSNRLAHVALTYDRSNGLARIFVEGQQVALANFGDITPETRTDVLIGHRPQGAWKFAGILDEITLYNRPLAGTEIGALANAVRSGKCRSRLPPRVVQEPQNLWIYSGELARFDARAAGDSPLGYRWFFNGAVVSNAFTETLLLPDVPLNAAGDYRLIVTNSSGSATSQLARLTVVPAPVCTPSPSGIVGWWPLDGSADDVIGANHGILLGGPFSTTGEVRQALLFDRVDDAVRIPATPDMNLGLSNGFTIELWVEPTDVGLLSPLVEWFDGVGPLGLHFWIGIAGAGAVTANLIDIAGTSHVISTAGSVVTNGGFSHLALTYDKATGIAVIYVNGQPSVSRSLGTFTVETRSDVQFARRPRAVGNEFLFSGVLDEVAFYRRALTAPEIASLHGALRAGKCIDALPPRIAYQPENQTVFAGDTVSISAGAAGIPPLTYRWYFNGSLIQGAGAATLVLPSVTTNQAGFYSLSVSNVGGIAFSSNAVLTVLTGATCVALPAGASAWWPMQFTGEDLLGTNRLVLTGDPAFVPGRSGLGLRIDGQNDTIRAPASPATDLGTASGLTIEFWTKPTDPSAVKPLLEWNNSAGGNGLLIWTSFGSPGGIFANLIDINGTAHTITTPPALISAAWQHIALTYDKAQGMAAIYVNGTLATNQTLGTFTPRTQYDVFFGQRPPAGGPLYLYEGLMDEVTFYRRVLSAAEISAIFVARDAGKCRAPIPPTFVRQPQSATVYHDEPISFGGEAIGDTPMSYQWLLDGVPLAGQTNTSLTLSNITFAAAGGYSLRVSNVGGTVASAVATLTVLPIPPCVAPPAGLIAWWPLDGDGTERVAGNNALLLGNPRFARGKVGTALLLDRVDDAARVPIAPSLDIGNAPGITIELWVMPFDTTNQSPLVEWSTGQGLVGLQLWCAASGKGTIHANLFDVYGNSHTVATPTGTVTNRLHHVALTYDRLGGVGALFVDGRLAVSQAVGSFPLETRYDVHFGRRPQGALSEYLFGGVLDEIAFYGRALGSNEIAAIATAGPAGKCQVPIPPGFVQQPESTDVFQGDSMTFMARAAGAPPLRYQWRFNGAALAGKTNSSLVLSNVQPAAAGNYSVAVTGPTGVTLSSNATLTVRPLVGCTGPPAGLVGWWPMDGTPTELLTQAPGTSASNPTFPAGLVGPAVRFDGIDDAFSVSATSNFNVGLGPGFTIETWIYPEDAIQPRPVLEWNNRLGGVGVALWISTGDANVANAGRLFANVIDTNDVAHRLISPTGVIVQNRWQHIALTYERTNGTAKLYRDGALVAQAVLGSFTPQTGPTYQLFFGWRYGPNNTGFHFFGSIDEAAIYKRPLDSNEIQLLYRAYADGKCKPVYPPVVLASPQDITLLAGAPAVLDAVVSGSEPLGYQWFRDGASVSGGTNAFLVRPAVRSLDAGNYFLVVTNAAGAATSQLARLDVLVERTIEIVSPGVSPAGGLVEVPVRLFSQGEVGALTFSMRFDPSVLSFSEVIWSSALQQAVKQASVPEAGEARLVFALPNSAVLAGTQTLAVAQFHARTAPWDTTTALEPELIDAAHPSGELLGYGTDTLPGVARVLLGGGHADNNGNGGTDLGDVTLLLRLLTALDTTRLWDVSRNDLNFNGLLDSGDVIQLLRLVMDNQIAASPGGFTPAASPRAVVVPNTLVAAAGTSITISVRLEGLGRQPAGTVLTLDFPTNAVRLSGPQNILAGPMIPPSATIAWNLAPARTNFSTQTGRLVFAASSASTWSADQGTLAEFQFQVQPGISNQLSWPLMLSSVQVTPDGYLTIPLTTAGMTLFSMPSPITRLRIAGYHPATGFEFWLDGETGSQLRIEASSNLVHWTHLTNVILQSSSIRFLDPSAASRPFQFYRTRLEE